MAVLTIELNNISQEEIIDYEKEHNVKIDELFHYYLQTLLKKPTTPTSKIDDAFGKYHQFAKNHSSIDDMNQSVADYFAKEWQS